MWVHACVYAHFTDGVLCREPKSRDETPGGPEESTSTKAQYTCRLYRCTKYICLYICGAAGLDDLGRSHLVFPMCNEYLERYIGFHVRSRM